MYDECRHDVMFRFDSDHDGVLSVREVALVFRSIGCSPTEAELQVSTAALQHIS